MQKTFYKINPIFLSPTCSSVFTHYQRDWYPPVIRCKALRLCLAFIFIGPHDQWVAKYHCFWPQTICHSWAFCSNLIALQEIRLLLSFLRMTAGVSTCSVLPLVPQRKQKLRLPVNFFNTQLYSRYCSAQESTAISTEVQVPLQPRLQNCLFCFHRLLHFSNSTLILNSSHVELCTSVVSLHLGVKTTFLCLPHIHATNSQKSLDVHIFSIFQEQL